MKPIAVVCILLAIAVGVLILLYALEVRSRRREVELAAAAEGLRWMRLLEQQQVQNEALLSALRDELAQAFDRIQAPEAAIAFSQSERAAKTMTGQPEGPVATEEQEVSLAELQRQTDQFVAEEFARRGIDPSELSAELAEPSLGR